MIQNPSEELRAAFAAVGETTTAAGQPKYPKSAVHLLARTVVCRAYAKPILQLCHLILIAEACEGAQGYASFFFTSVSATGRNYRAALDRAFTLQPQRTDIRPTENGVAVGYEDGEFAVAYSRMPFLTALLDFLVTALGFSEVDEVMSNLKSVTPRKQKSVGAAANEISRQLYQYLADHLPSVQSQDKFQAVLEFAKTENAEVLEVDDAAVLAFWRRFSSADDSPGDFRSFRTVFDSFVDFVRAVEAAQSRTAFDRPATIGGDRDAGEIDPNELADIVEATDEWRSPLEALDDEPANRIRFLNKTERDAIDVVMATGPQGLKLPISLLRAEVFGATQARITQALRNRDRQRVADLTSCEETESYEGRAQRYDAIQQHIQRVLKAAAHVLLAPAQEAADGTSNVVAFPGGAVIDDSVSDEIERAFKGISRRGFDASALTESETQDGFRMGSEALVATRDHLATYFDSVERAANGDGGWSTLFSRDREAFCQQFVEIYKESP